MAVKELASVNVGGEKVSACNYGNGTYGVEVMGCYQVEEFTAEHKPLLEAIIKDMGEV